MNADCFIEVSKVIQRLQGRDGFDAPVLSEPVLDAGPSKRLASIFSKPSPFYSRIGDTFRNFGIAVCYTPGLLSFQHINFYIQSLKVEKILYMGDFDPPDILNACQLMHAFPDEFIYGPYSSSFINALPPSTEKRITMAMSASEAESLKEITPFVLPLKEFLHEWIYDLFKENRKIEIDAVNLLWTDFVRWVGDLAN